MNIRRYNHMYTIAFEVVNTSPDGEETTAEEIREAVLKRVNSIPDSEVLEAVGGPDDTYEEDYDE